MRRAVGVAETKSNSELIRIRRVNQVAADDDELSVADVFDRLFYRSEDHDDSLSKR